MIRGYIRLTTETESIQKQLEALINESVPDSLITIESAQEPLSLNNIPLEKGDTLVVWRLDVLGFFICDLKDYLNELRKQGVFIKSLQDKIDTSLSDADEKVFYKHLNASADNEMAVKKSRIKSGLKKAIAAGKQPVRPKVIDASKEQEIDEMLKAGLSVTAICEKLKIKRGTFYLWKNRSKTPSDG